MKRGALKNHFTPREKQVLELVCAGGTNQSAAKELGISIETVKIHLYRIFDKSGHGTRTELAIWANDRKRKQQVVRIRKYIEASLKSGDSEPLREALKVLEERS
ncbi:MAG: response regulator transcription factor [Candidatus Micrarchaeaceae archaeon]